MDVAQVEASLLRLQASPAARALFLSDSRAFGEQEGLPSEDLAALRTRVEALGLFAQSGLHQRTREAGQHLRRTRGLLNGTFAQTFEAYVATRPAAIDPLQDAVHFLQWLPGHAAENDALLQIARYELAELEVKRGDRWLRFGHFRLPSQPDGFWAIWLRGLRAGTCWSWRSRR